MYTTWQSDYLTNAIFDWEDQDLRFCPIIFYEKISTSTISDEIKRKFEFQLLIGKG